jgi:cytochrome c oxidase cbb3-type subunit 3
MRPALIAVLALALSGGSLAAQSEPLPDGVTPAMVATGEAFFKSIGLCFACHGVDAKGIQGIGANLTDTEWYHGDGTYPSLVSQILDGVSPQVSGTGVMMPPKGGSQITEGQVRAIAAYVWSLSRGDETAAGS